MVQVCGVVYSTLKSHVSLKQPMQTDHTALLASNALAIPKEITTPYTESACAWPANIDSDHSNNNGHHCQVQEHIGRIKYTSIR